MGSEQKDFDQAVGEWFLTHGNLDGIIFDKIEEAKQYAESKSRETGANQNLRFNYQTESGTTNILTLASSQATSLINEIKNNFAMMEAERERVAGREPNQREKILVGKVINKIIDQMSTLITKQAESDLTFRAISSEVTKKKKESEDFKNLLETTEGLSDQIKDYFSNQIKNKEKEILELEANKNIVGQTINNFDSLLSDYQQRKLIS